MNYILSPSALNLMKECPRCFWLHHNKVWKRPSGIFPSLPSGMDRILKTHFDKFRDKGQLPPELCNKGKHCEDVKLFGSTKEEKELLEVWRNNKKGISFKDEEGNILKGAVDNLLEKDGELIVLDYKTRGYALKEDTAEHSRRQLDIYNFLLRKNGYKTKNYSFLLFYIPKEVLSTGEIIFDTELVKMETNPEEGEKFFKEALKLLNGKCPEKHKHADCEWCRVIEAEAD